MPRGGLRHTPTETQEREATHTWIREFGLSLAYLIRHTEPKDAGEKLERKRRLLGIRNAIRVTKVRPSLAAPAVAPVKQVNKDDTPDTPDTSEKSDTPPAAPAPTPLRVDIVMPTGPVPTPRPGTTAGDPFLLTSVPEEPNDAHAGD